MDNSRRVKMFFTTGEFAWCPALNETVRHKLYRKECRTIKNIDAASLSFRTLRKVVKLLEAMSASFPVHIQVQEVSLRYILADSLPFSFNMSDCILHYKLYYKHCTDVMHGRFGQFITVGKKKKKKKVCPDRVSNHLQPWKILKSILVDVRT